MKRIAIIGSGTGLFLARLLHNHGFDVTVYEAADRLGGHINTLKFPDGRIVEGGAEFLNPTYTCFFKLIEILGLKLNKFTATMEFTDLQNNTFLFTPCINDIFSKIAAYDKNKSFIENLENDINELAYLKKLYSIIFKFKQQEDKLTRNPIFLKDWITQIDEQDFAEKFIYPVLSSFYGVTSEQAKTKMTHYAMTYLITGSDCYEVRGGLSQYIDALKTHLDNINCTIKLSTKVQKITKVSDNKFLVKTEKGEDEYDNVAICVSAEAAKEILDENSCETSGLINIFSNVLYYDTVLSFNDNNSEEYCKKVVVHIKQTNEGAKTTATKSWNSNISKQWVTEATIPENNLAIVRYRHPMMNDKYYLAQEIMKAHNLKNNGLYFGSIMAGMNDSHESGIRASLNIARLLFKKYNFKTPKILKSFDSLDTGSEKMCCCF